MINERPNQEDRLGHMERKLVNELSAIKRMFMLNGTSPDSESVACIEEITEQTHQYVTDLIGRVEAIGEKIENTETAIDCVQDDVMRLEREIDSIGNRVLADLRYIANALKALDGRMDNLEV